MKKLGLAVAVSACALAAPASAATFVVTGAGFTLPDVSIFGPTTRTSSVTVGNLGTITSISLTLNGLTHDYVHDLDAFLSVSGGPTSQFMRNDYASAIDANGNYTFVDGGANFYGVTSGTAIPTGTYSGRGENNAAQNFAQFNGRSTVGTWVLNMSDQQFFNSGNLGSWTLTINYTPTAAPVPEPATWALMMLGFGAIGYTLRRRRARVSLATA